MKYNYWMFKVRCQSTIHGFCSHLGAVESGRRGCRCLWHTAALLALTFTLRLAEDRQQGAQLRDTNSAIFSMAIQQVLEHLSRQKLITPRLSRHSAQRAEKGQQGEDEYQLGPGDDGCLRGKAMVGPDKHGFFTGRQGLICGGKGKKKIM